MTAFLRARATFYRVTAILVGLAGASAATVLEPPFSVVLAMLTGCFATILWWQDA